jgi:hypothetical protein
MSGSKELHLATGGSRNLGKLKWCIEFMLLDLGEMRQAEWRNVSVARVTQTFDVSN